MSTIVLLETSNENYGTEITLFVKLGRTNLHDFICLKTADSLDEVVENKHPQAIAISASMEQFVSAEKLGKYGIPVLCYLRDKKARPDLTEKGYHVIAPVRDSNMLIEKISSFMKEYTEKKNSRKSSAAPQPVKTPTPSTPTTSAANHTAFSDTADDFPLEYSDPDFDEYTSDNTYEEGFSGYDDFEYTDDFPEEYSDDLSEEDDITHETEMSGSEEPVTAFPDNDIPESASLNTRLHSNPENPARTASSPHKESKKRDEYHPIKKDLSADDATVFRDAGLIKDDAVLIAINSAKGGVGKTTLTAELGTYMALVTRGRQKLRVCVVDMNIDYCNLAKTLNIIDETGTRNMTWWANDVRERLEKHMSTDYETEDIDEYLMQDQTSGLYILNAPVTNVDSSEVKAVEIEIILENLVKNGEFDYVICDTGNNLRDTTMIAVNKADLVLQVIDQDLNAVDSNREFFSTMLVLGYKSNIQKAKLVLNKVAPKKRSGISANDVIRYFAEHESFAPYHITAIGKLPLTDDIPKSITNGVPLVLDPNHSFTKELGKIVSFILNTDRFELSQPVSSKPSFFFKIKNLFKK